MSVSDSQVFSNLLQSLGYGQLGDSKGHSVPSSDWLFDHPTTRPFLIWLNRTLQKSKSLTPQEIAEYESIVQSNENANMSFVENDENEESIEDIREEVESLEKTEREMNASLERLLHLREGLSNHVNSVTQQTGNLISLQQEEENNKLHSTLTIQTSSSLPLHQKLNVSIKNFDNAIQSSSNAAKNLVQAYSSPSQPNLLSQCTSSLQSLEVLEDNILRVTNDFISIKLPQKEKNPHEVQNEEEEKASTMNAEICRLRDSLHSAYTHNLHARVKCAQVESALLFLKEIQNRDYSTLDINGIKLRTAEVENSVLMMQEKVNSYMQNNIAPLVQQSADAKLSPALLLSYSQKEQRNQIRLSMLSKAATHINESYSRRRFLSHVLNIEESNLHNSLDLLLGLRREMSNWKNDQENRLLVCSDIVKNSSLSLSAIIPQTDSAMVRLWQILEVEQVTSSVVLSLLTYEGLIDASKIWTHALKSTTVMNSELESERVNLVAQLIQNVSRLSVLASSVHINEITSLNTDLKNLLQQLELSVSEILRFQRSKQEEISYMGADLEEERELYVYFFIRPDILVKKWKELYARANTSIMIANSTKK
eukprot:TRINITY_DN4308_c0_g1_i1.p1 TRINITY_DN4308_c0_g1~~TRINITY_DN4308_c0_g1_i1.p1  ORF type:complete len:595 (-),score=99.06 TRINITY_DN4308_c0_g1_i1:91-1875(-)